MPISHRFRALVLAIGLGLVAAPALAQSPYPPAPGYPPQPGYPPTGPAASCLCLKQSVDASAADMNSKQAALNAAQAQLNQIDSELAAARSHVDVNDPQSVAQFRQLLAQRDAAYRQSSGAVITAAQDATTRYNAAVAAYNGSCAGRPLPPPPPGPLACPGP